MDSFLLAMLICFLLMTFGPIILELTFCLIITTCELVAFASSFVYKNSTTKVQGLLLDLAIRLNYTLCLGILISLILLLPCALKPLTPCLKFITGLRIQTVKSRDALSAERLKHRTTASQKSQCEFSLNQENYLRKAAEDAVENMAKQHAEEVLHLNIELANMNTSNGHAVKVTNWKTAQDEECIRDLEDQLSKKDHEIEKLEGHVDCIKDEVKRLTKLTETSEGKIKDINGKAQIFENQTTMLKGMVIDLEAKKTEHEKVVEELNQMLKKAKTDYSDQVDEGFENKKNLDELCTLFKGVFTATENPDGEQTYGIERLKTDLKDHLEGFKEAYKQADIDKSYANEAVKILRPGEDVVEMSTHDILFHMTTNIVEIRKEYHEKVSSLEGVIIEKESEKLNVENKLSTQVKEMKRLQASIDIKKKEISSHGDALSAKDKEISRLRGDVELKDERLVLLQNNVNTNDEKVLRLERDAKTKAEEHSQFRNDSNAEILRLQGDVKIKHEELSRVQNNINNWNAEIQRLQGDVTIKNEELSRLQVLVNSNGTEISRLEGVNNHQDEEIKRLQGLDTDAATILRLESTIRDKTAENNHLNGIITSTGKNTRRLENLVSQKERELMFTGGNFLSAKDDARNKDAEIARLQSLRTTDSEKYLKLEESKRVEVSNLQMLLVSKDEKISQLQNCTDNSDLDDILFGTAMVEDDQQMSIDQSGPAFYAHELARLKEDIDLKEKTIENMQATIEEKNAEIQSLSPAETPEPQSMQIKRLRREAAEGRASVETLRTELEKTKEELKFVYKIRTGQINQAKERNIADEAIDEAWKASMTRIGTDTNSIPLDFSVYDYISSMEELVERYKTLCNKQAREQRVLKRTIKIAKSAAKKSSAASAGGDEMEDSTDEDTETDEEDDTQETNKEDEMIDEENDTQETNKEDEMIDEENDINEDDEEMEPREDTADQNLRRALMAELARCEVQQVKPAPPMSEAAIIFNQKMSETGFSVDQVKFK